MHITSRIEWATTNNRKKHEKKSKMNLESPLAVVASEAGLVEDSLVGRQTIDKVHRLLAHRALLLSPYKRHFFSLSVSLPPSVCLVLRKNKRRDRKWEELMAQTKARAEGMNWWREGEANKKRARKREKERKKRKHGNDERLRAQIGVVMCPSLSRICQKKQSRWNSQKMVTSNGFIVYWQYHIRFWGIEYGYKFLWYKLIFDTCCRF